MLSSSKHLKEESEDTAAVEPSVLAGGRNMNLGKRDSTRGGNARAALFDGLEEGGLRAGTSFSTSEIAEQENERGLDTLADRVSILKRITTDIHSEAESHHSLLDQMGRNMDGARGMLSGTVDRMTKVFQTKSGRQIFYIVASCVAIFLLIYFLRR
eukprot:TRINITY_DN13611_c0_g1_i1.p1 TRINITY_DN13611_c0_g1~~TRINITY_DN13611_c0_g1_i1.p1  ORF type:complete len:156 (+),score=15.46 TRINITY_DN13611_c0_g1_i1:103-570(+)